MPVDPVVISRDQHTLSRANISPNALKVLYRLKAAGYEAHLVGGGVRDLLLGREPKDFDVATDARPEDVREVFISRKYGALGEMPAGAKLGTSSLRRRSQAKVANPSIELVDFRGNVQTRLSKLASGEVDVVILAAAGLERLELDIPACHPLRPPHFLPAPGQGASRGWRSTSFPLGSIRRARTDQPAGHTS